MDKIGEIDNDAYYEKAFNQASQLIKKTNKKKYKHLIILLTDGADNDNVKDAFVGINKVIKYFLIF